MKIFFIFLFLFTLNCSTNKVSKIHGFKSIESKFEKLEVNKTNKNDVKRIIGPPSSKSEFNNNVQKEYYINNPDKKVEQNGRKREYHKKHILPYHIKVDQYVFTKCDVHSSK